MASPQVEIPGYELQRELGAGGMATVFLALQRSLERQVAIKVMRRGGSDEGMEKRFLLEGRTMAKLPHRNIVGVYDIVQTAEINYIAMEFLGGGTLSDRLRDGLSLGEAIAIVVQIAGALQFAHDNGVVHRDLKPANIMFRDRFTPVLTDFGIARQRDAQATRLTQTGMMIGTPTYMSPEQAMGEDVDGRSDQYSLGVLFYEMLTGEAPFTGETPLNVVLAHLHQPAPPLPAQFAHFQPVMDRLLSKKPEHRYDDLKQFVAELKSLLTHSETLMARLRIDPSQSASEQLRALGFSESQINTGQGTTPAAMSAAASARGGSGRTGRSRSASGPGVRLDPPTRARPLPRWAWPAAAAAAVLVLVLATWALLGRDSLSPELRSLVDDSLASADRMIEAGQLVAPSGENAYEKVQAVLQVAPGLPEAEQRLDRIVAALRGDAEDALQRGAFAVAETRIGEALAVRPEAAELLALRQRLETAKLDAAREAQVRQMLASAAEAERAGRVLSGGADSAIAFLRQAAQLAPAHPQVRERLAALRDTALAPVRAELSAGRLDAARERHAALAEHFAADAAWQSLQSDIQAATDRAAAQQRVAALLAQAEAQRKAGRLATPAGDNALETLARLAELDAGNAAAATLRRQLGEQLAAQARAAEQRGAVTEALDLYARALQAQPDAAAVAAARQALEARVGEREARIGRALAAARAAITQRRLLSPAGDSARSHLDAVLALDAGNAEARALLAQLPRLVRDTAEELAAEQRIGDALALLQEAVRQYPEDATLALRASELRREGERQAQAAQREERLAALRELMAQRQLNADTARGIGGLLRQLLDADPTDRDALAIRESFVQGIARVIAGATDPAMLAQIEPVLAQVRATLGSGPDVASLASDFAATAERLAAAERARIAASAGVLVLNAQPWATVESVVEQGSGTRVELPKDASTPLRLSVPAGSYRVAFRHPSAPDAIVLLGRVEARQSASVAARFPTLTADRLLRDAGFTP